MIFLANEELENSLGMEWENQISSTEGELRKEPEVAFSVIIEVVELVVGAVCLMLFLTAFLLRTVEVKGNSMLPTLESGERLLVLVNNGYVGTPKKGDIVVINQPNAYQESLIKRCIAEGGDEVDIDFELGEVRVNEVLLNEEYINESTYLYEGIEFPLTVPKGFVFCMGDNRNHSSDSRDPGIGLIDERYVNKVIFRCLPPNRMGRI